MLSTSDLVITTNARTGAVRIHKANCKRQGNSIPVSSLSGPEDVLRAVAATCCRPRGVEDLQADLRLSLQQDADAATYATPEALEPTEEELAEAEVFDEPTEAEFAEAMAELVTEPVPPRRRPRKPVKKTLNLGPLTVEVEEPAAPAAPAAPAELPPCLHRHGTDKARARCLAEREAAAKRGARFGDDVIGATPEDGVPPCTHRHGTDKARARCLAEREAIARRIEKTSGNLL